MVRVKKITLEDNLYYKRNLLLYYKIEYPQFYSNKYQNKLNKINSYYMNKALEIQRNCVSVMFRTSIGQFEYAVSRGYPTRQFLLEYIYNITLNEDCSISLYYDKYTYMGGAHGRTLRTSDSWDIQSGERIQLCYLFNEDINYYDYLKTSIIQQIEQQLKNKEYIYFHNFPANIADNLDINNFYLNKYGVVIYFQQYEIAPYAAGIPEFTVPYENGILMKPICE